ncbi:unnamed protein product [Rotaria magnacalcarata]|uniref:Uncharacterized protein n=2 Tax=Rotaria magnacalcarata TaxID=392030 RepID=A0A814ZNZ1_9BILA|nr:unnamed protein product [Rotaria magnacalcarata]CAF1393185.1 unnamed protein product [Rotaria magnacalcarata]CAF2166534.1 unnamed protein product [Rotaria magnacalcarata]CAF2257331.1 unnamed protein product [Rotaria magnacalcarata]CAF2258485.1 unnamed protein product [Rotaria magnacalcarata]
MFHIFHWSRERINDKKTTSDLSGGERYKRHHARQYRLRVPHESKSRQDLIYTKKLRLAPDSDKQQNRISDDRSRDWLRQRSWYESS